jgi:very-short-patch-repair endonuclease
MAKRPWKTAGDLWGNLKSRARQMRKDPTPAEELLWSRLRRNLIDGNHFRRQHTIGPAVPDFYCGAAKLVIELDGPIHERQRKEDLLRQEWLESNGFRVLRFTNERALNHTDEVVAEITAAVRAYNPRYRKSR